MSKSRGYCFTANNYTSVTIAQLMELYEEGIVSYIVIGFETAPETGTPHIQGYMHFDNPRGMNSIHKKVDGLHLEVPRATGTKYSLRYEYCMKGEQEKEEWQTEGVKGRNYGLNADFIEYGDRPNDGVYKITTQVATAIRNGSTYEELVEEFPEYCLQQSRNVKAHIQDVRQYRHPKLYVIESSPTLVGDIEHTFPDRRIQYIEYDEMNQVESLPDTYDDVVVYYVASHILKYDLWGRGQTILYKNGYEFKKLRCADLVLVVPNKKDINMYLHYKHIRTGVSQY